MRLRSRGVGIVGLVFVAVVALGMLSGRLTVPEAGVRVGAAFVVLLLVDRLLLPLAAALVGERQVVQDEAPDVTEAER